ncbi:hypothetical protein Tco_0212013 [Tanacetum coccineum]
MAQQVIPSAQLVPRFHTIGRCNNYAVLQSIPCSPECKIVGQILLDHPLMDMFQDILHLPVETPENQFVASVNIETIEAFMNRVGYQGVVDKAFLTEEIHATDDFKEYETVFMNVDVPMNQPQLVVSTQGTHRSTPRAHRTPTLTARDDKERDAIAEATLLSLALHKTALAAKAQENFAKVQEKLDEEEIEKNEIEKEKKDEEVEKENKDKEIEKEKEDVEIVKEKDIADDGMGSKEIMKEQKHTLIPSPTRSPRNVSSSDKIVSEELTATISPTTATTSKDSFTTKRKKRSSSHKTKTLPSSIAGMCRRRRLIRSHIKNKFATHDFFMSKIREVLDHCNKLTKIMKNTDPPEGGETWRKDNFGKIKANNEKESFVNGRPILPTMKRLLTHSNPESSKDKQTDASDSESSSCSETLKPFDNYMPLIERVLVRNLQGISKVLYAHVAEDNREKHEEAASSYADLKWSIEDFHTTTFRNYDNIDASLINYEKILTKFKFDHNVLKAAEAYTKNSTNLTELLTLVESSASVAWSDGPRMTRIENTQATIQSDIASLKTDTANIKAMMTEMFYAFKGGDGSSKNYKVLSEMLEDFDRQDVEELYRLVKERYSASRPEGYDLMLWGDLHTLFEPDEEDEIWKNQHEYNVISWSLYDFCGIHILLMQNGIAIHMLTEKKYPLSQEMISKMLKKKLEVDHESSQAFELLSTNGVSTASTNLVLPELVNTARRKINTADGRSC